MNTNDHACNILIYQYDNKSYDIMSLMLNYNSYLNALTKLLPLFVLVFLTLFSIWNSMWTFPSSLPKCQMYSVLGDTGMPGLTFFFS